MSVSHSAVGVVTGRNTSKGKEAEGTFPDKIRSRETGPPAGLEKSNEYGWRP